MYVDDVRSSQILTTFRTIASVMKFLVDIKMTNCGVLTDRDTLYSDIFRNYSAKTLPVINHTKQARVSFVAFIANINNFEEKSGELQITVTFYLNWVEERISWNPADYSNITSMLVCPEDTWRPQMFLLESSDYVRDLSNASIKPRISYTGEIQWYTGNALKVSCSVDVTYFPLDKQKCEMTFYNWDSEQTELLFYPNQTDVSLLYFKTNSQWKIESGILKNCTDIPGSCISLVMILQRRYDFYLIYIVIPLIFLSLINNLVFLMPASSGERTSVAVTTFLSFVVYMDMVNDLVPQSSEPMAYIYIFIMSLMIYSCVVMFLCIVSLMIYDRKGRVPRRLAKVIWFLRFRFLTSKSHDNHTCAKRDEFAKHQGASASTDQAEHLEKQTTDVHDITWYTVGTTFDVYCLLILYIALTVFGLQTLTVIASGD